MQFMNYACANIHSSKSLLVLHGKELLFFVGARTQEAIWETMFPLLLDKSGMLYIF